MNFSRNVLAVLVIMKCTQAMEARDLEWNGGGYVYSKKVTKYEHNLNVRYTGPTFDDPLTLHNQHVVDRKVNTGEKGRLSKFHEDPEYVYFQRNHDLSHHVAIRFVDLTKIERPPVTIKLSVDILKKAVKSKLEKNFGPDEYFQCKACKEKDNIHDLPFWKKHSSGALVVFFESSKGCGVAITGYNHEICGAPKNAKAWAPPSGHAWRKCDKITQILINGFGKEGTVKYLPGLLRPELLENGEMLVNKEYLDGWFDAYQLIPGFQLKGLKPHIGCIIEMMIAEAEAVLNVGDKVKARQEGSDVWEHGTVTDVNHMSLYEFSLYTVEFDNGSLQPDLERSQIRKL
jgi:hypothetical protein